MLTVDSCPLATGTPHMMLIGTTFTSERENSASLKPQQFSFSTGCIVSAIVEDPQNIYFVQKESLWQHLIDF